MTNRIRSKNSWQCLLSKGTGKSALCPASIAVYIPDPAALPVRRQERRFSLQNFCQFLSGCAQRGEKTIDKRKGLCYDEGTVCTGCYKHCFPAPPARLGRLSFRDSGLQGFPGPASKLHGGYRKSRGSPGKAVFRTCCQLACQRKCNPRQHQKPFPFSASPGCFPMSARTA